MEPRMVAVRVGASFALLLFVLLAITSTTAGWLKVVMVVGGLVSVACAFASRPAEPE